MEVCKKPHRFAGREYLYSWYKPGGEVMRCEAPLVGIDTETHLIENRYEVPLGVVAGLCSGRQVQLVMWTEWEEYFPKFLRLNPTVKLVFFNGPFDMKVIGEKIFIPELAKDNRVMELRASYRQTRIATQGWFPSSTTLASITKEVTGVELDKESGVRTSYLRGNDITEAQEHYLCDDAIATYTCGCTFNNTPTESLQARASWVLAEVSRNGMFVDLPYVREQVAKVSKEMEELVATLKTFGFTIKDAVEDLTQVQRVIRIFDLFGMDISLQMKDAGIKTIPRNWLIVACATMYNAIRRGGVMPSDLTGNLRQLLKVILDPPPKCAASESFFDSFREVLTRRLKKLDCIECLEGCGNAKMRSNTPLLIFLEKLAELFKQGKLFDSMKPFDDAFRELHEENYGWLPTAPKKLAPLAFLQKHLDEMMAQHEDLKFPYTPAAKKAIKRRMREAKRNALPGEPITVDVSDLEKFQIKAFDMWILKDAGLTDPFLEAYFRYKHHEKLLSTYITEKYVEKDGRVHPRFETLLRTGRTSCSSPNLQNMPREDGLREMYKAPDGKCLVSTDYGQQELVVLAYTLKQRYGKSVMYNLINVGLDLHGTFSLYRDGKLEGIDLHNLTNEDVRKIKEMCKPYKEEPELKRSRGLSKAANFGFGGGMGVETFYVNCRRQGFDVTQEQCAELREAWFNLYSEMQMYINPQRDGQVALSVLEGDNEKEEENDEGVEEAESNADNGVEEEMVQLYCADTVFGQHRARSTYASANNFAFQAGASTVSKLALWLVYLDSIKNDYKIVDFVHDEIIVECNEEDVDSVGKRVGELMVKAANTLMPGILITAEPAAMYRWSKKAEPAFDKNGKLIPWDSVENKELN